MNALTEISWLHISDIHLDTGKGEWAQNAVLRDLVRDVEARAGATTGPDFVVLSGDLVWSGKRKQFEAVHEFLKALCEATSLPNNRIFCVPGNHDIDRVVQRYCYLGAQGALQSPQAVDEFLGDEVERAQLYERFAAYSTFARRYWDDDERTATPEGLGYVANFAVKDVLPLTIVGLNSSWLCGGDQDCKHILLGERQIIDALELAAEHDARLVLAVAHHPPDWLREFDQQAFDRRLATACDFFHHGHLHEPNVQSVSRASRQSCIMLAAGAGHASRHYGNSYSWVRLDIATSLCEVTTLEYVSSAGRFDARPEEVVPVVLRGEMPAGMAGVAACIQALGSPAAQHAHYLAALLCDGKVEVPVRFDKEVVLTRPELRESRNQTGPVDEFLAMRSLLRAFRSNVTLVDRVESLKDRIIGYADWLQEAARASPDLAALLVQQEKQSATLARAIDADPFQHTTQLLEAISSDRDWVSLEHCSRRQLGLPGFENVAKRFLAMALSQSEDPTKRDEALSLAVSLAEETDATRGDLALAASLLHQADRSEEAKQLVLRALAAQGPNGALLEIGNRLAMDLGDAELREQLEMSKQAALGKDV